MNRRLPGTDKNFERSGDRDLYWSMLLRFPYPCRSLDLDALSDLGAQIICSRCHFPKLLMECVRFREGGILAKDSYITETWARVFGCPAFVVSHNGEFKPSQGFSTKDECQAAWDNQRKPATSFIISPRPEGELISFYEDAEEQFILWIEKIMGSHRCSVRNYTSKL